MVQFDSYCYCGSANPRIMVSIYSMYRLRMVGWKCCTNFWKHCFYKQQCVCVHNLEWWCRLCTCLCISKFKLFGTYKQTTDRYGDICQFEDYQSWVANTSIQQSIILTLCLDYFSYNKSANNWEALATCTSTLPAPPPHGGTTQDGGTQAVYCLHIILSCITTYWQDEQRPFSALNVQLWNNWKLPTPTKIMYFYQV